ncbi:uncharacterized protein UV8b_07181 [Ustilaginoidea virens]|uniref:Cation efflux protein transmembrane domain-containing protein n=1 Tax=Ustilaginoidea virens TaxID=1159556 RepID=A0A8E5HWK0_USTVR|nr:uncharacterized protein UV8b_07181 [Ustilaginoidea virens]QUC22940.1 hypothetical protein UV8b_07181 [Ustilaginoidea virens]
MVGKRSLGEAAAESRAHDARPGHRRRKTSYNLEYGAHSAPGDNHAPIKPSILRFRDAARTALEDARREELKASLLNGLDTSHLERFRKHPDELGRIKSKPLRRFYERQNEMLNDWLEVDAVVTAIADDVLESMNPDPDHDGDQERVGGLQHVAGRIGELLPDDEKARRREAARQASVAINTNVVANLVLLAGKAFAVFTTGSLSLLASLVDSALDLLCTLIIWSTNRIVLWRLSALRKRFPVGKRRLEPMGILVFSIIMVISFLQILQESVQRLMPPRAEIEALSTAAIVSLVATIAIKGIIGLGCLPIKTTQVRALVQDCKTDVIFNALSLLFPLVGHRAGVWWLDSVGAALLSLFIICDWGRTCFENIVRLSGEAADERVYRKLTFLAYRFSPVVRGIKSITAYHAGDGVWAEFDLLLDEHTRLNRSHDISETLQYCAEGLAEVDRAFVATDYAMIGPTGHAEDSEWNH